MCCSRKFKHTRVFCSWIRIWVFLTNIFLKTFFSFLQICRNSKTGVNAIYSFALDSHRNGTNYATVDHTLDFTSCSTETYQKIYTGNQNKYYNYGDMKPRKLAWNNCHVHNYRSNKTEKALVCLQLKLANLKWFRSVLVQNQCKCYILVKNFRSSSESTSSISRIMLYFKSIIFNFNW